jgi:hypothetical protein
VVVVAVATAATSGAGCVPTLTPSAWDSLHADSPSDAEAPIATYNHVRLRCIVFSISKAAVNSAAASP